MKLSGISTTNRKSRIRQIGIGLGLTGLLLINSGIGRAETVTQKQASQLAQAFYNAAHGEVMAAPKVVYNGRRLTTQSLFVPFYVYNFPAGGYVIISAENKTYPILGYDLSKNFDAEKIGPKLQALLRSYALDIEKIRYDSEIPYKAIEAWTDFPEYVKGILGADSEITDVVIEESDADYTIELISEQEEGHNSSWTYTPEQWETEINNELGKSRNVMLGVWDRNKFVPMIVQGHKGDYYRLSLDGHNNAMYRLHASELYSGGQIANLSGEVKPIAVEKEEPAFEFYENFLAETRATEEQAQRSIENAGIVSTPEVSFLGGGHYVIKVPEDITRMNLYNVGGALIAQQYYKGTDTANLDISVEPGGFYIAVIEGESGQSYGFKLAR